VYLNERPALAFPSPRYFWYLADSCQADLRSTQQWDPSSTQLA